MHSPRVAAPDPAPWVVKDGFETGELSSAWTPYPLTQAGITTDVAHKGRRSFRVTYSDYKYTLPSPIKKGKISWWHLEGSGTPWTYMYILTDTNHVNLGDYNLHVVTNLPDTYSFYHYSLGYKYGIPRTPGWHKWVAEIDKGRISLSVDGQVGIEVEVAQPVIAFQIAGGIIDDFRAVSKK